MDLSVVIPTLNSRTHLSACLDALSRRAGDVEVVVVNGPSTDGTTGMIHDRDDVSVLVEVATRNINAARNVGLREATGEAIALLGPEYRVEPTWADAVRSAISSGAAVVSGPTLLSGDDDHTVAMPTSRSIAGRLVTELTGRNLAMSRETVTALDGFDAYLTRGGARDLSHRLAGNDLLVSWEPRMSVRGELEADGGTSDGVRERHLPEPDGTKTRDLCLGYRALSYTLVKNYGAHPTVARRIVGAAVGDAVTSARDVVRGSATPSTWLGSGVGVVKNVAIGTKDGIGARYADRSPARNPNGVERTVPTRVVECYDWR